MKHCGNQKCLGNVCENWTKCRGETIPPWNFDQRHTTTAEVSVREQDILAAADALAAVLEKYIDHTSDGQTVIDGGYCEIERAREIYINERMGKRNT